jgi:hypothetical protein
MVNSLATLRKVLKCEVCESKTLVRIQLGWLDSHPVRLNCGSCGILISGILILNQLQGTALIQFENAMEVDNEDSTDFYIEASGELLTEKLQPYKYENTLFAPFFTSGIDMMGENLGVFKRKTMQFLMKKNNYWPHYRRINELWHRKNYTYLVSELKKYIPNKSFPLNNELHFLMAVHQMNIEFLSNVLDDQFFNRNSSFVMNELVSLFQRSPKEFGELTNYFSESLHRYEEKIFECIEIFVEKFNYMIPVFGLSFYQDKSFIFNAKGITTVAFNDLKRFYIDVYEVLTEMLELLIALNNLKHRGNFNSMKTKRRDVSTLEDYISKNKGAKAEFLDGSETFDNLIYPNLNVKLRNAIGHYTYRVDGINQIITYYPSGNEKIEDPPKMSLVEFVQNCWNIFQSLINFSELVYQTRKIIYLKQGFVPAFEHVFQDNKKPKVKKGVNKIKIKRKNAKATKRKNRNKK